MIVPTVGLILVAISAFLLIYKLEQIHREERNELQNRIALKGEAVIRPPSERVSVPSEPPENDDFNRVGVIVSGEQNE